MCAIILLEQQHRSPNAVDEQFCKFSNHKLLTQKATTLLVQFKFSIYWHYFCMFSETFFLAILAVFTSSFCKLIEKIFSDQTTNIFILTQKQVIITARGCLSTARGRGGRWAREPGRKSWGGILGRKSWGEILGRKFWGNFRLRPCASSCLEVRLELAWWLRWWEQ